MGLSLKEEGGGLLFLRCSLLNSPSPHTNTQLSANGRRANFARAFSLMDTISGVGRLKVLLRYFRFTERISNVSVTPRSFAFSLCVFVCCEFCSLRTPRACEPRIFYRHPQDLVSNSVCQGFDCFSPVYCFLLFSIVF